MAICGLGNCIWSAPQSKGIFRWDLTVPVRADFPENADIDLSDPEENKKFFLRDEYFGTFAPAVRESIQASEGDWRPWRLFYMPPDCFDWPAHADVTLIGDAAHASTPWVGDGVNCAMRDALVLSKSLQELGVTQDAVAAYEKEMFVWASDLIRRSVFSGEMFLAKDNPTRLAEFLKTSIGDLIGHTDNV
jgi:2-polyprenyl-6-methoxyphenol hydroxylase-like FAD-dependent oxidoreductase